MAQSNTPADVRLICGMISADAALFGQACEAMAKEFSAIDIRSEVMPFDFTHYYDEEMGSPLYRQFVSFATCVKPDALTAAKVFTNKLEAEFASRQAGIQTQPGATVPQETTKTPVRVPHDKSGPARPINLDPGYVDESKLILASMKNFSHRIYLGQGVYAELTLMYHKGHWDALNWTFPDFASGRYSPFLTEVRTALRGHLQEQRACSTGILPVSSSVAQPPSGVSSEPRQQQQDSETQPRNNEETTKTQPRAAVPQQQQQDAGETPAEDMGGTPMLHPEEP